MEPPVIHYKQRNRERAERGGWRRGTHAVKPQTTFWFSTTHPCPWSLQALIVVPSTPAEERERYEGNGVSWGRWQKYGVFVNTVVPAASREGSGRWNSQWGHIQQLMEPRGSGSVFWMCVSVSANSYVCLAWGQEVCGFGCGDERLDRLPSLSSRPLLWTLLWFEGDAGGGNQGVIFGMETGVKRLWQEGGTAYHGVGQRF